MAFFGAQTPSERMVLVARSTQPPEKGANAGISNATKIPTVSQAINLPENSPNANQKEIIRYSARQPQEIF